MKELPEEAKERERERESPSVLGDYEEALYADPELQNGEEDVEGP